MKTDEVCERPLETFGACTPMLLGFVCFWCFFSSLLLENWYMTDLISTI